MRSSATDRLLAVTTIGFDIAALELYLPLLGGACVAVAPARDGEGRAGAARAIAASGATVMQATPTLWQALVEPRQRDASAKHGATEGVLAGWRRLRACGCWWAARR